MRTRAETITAENVRRLFPEVNTTLATTARAEDNDLEGYDEEQIRLMDEVCIVLDEDDVPIGSASKKVCASPSRCPRISMQRADCTGRPLDEEHRSGPLASRLLSIFI